jgi:hypothetical protein
MGKALFLYLMRGDWHLVNYRANQRSAITRTYALIARFTKFSISGILNPLWARARAPSDAIPATLAAVTAPLALPRIACSTLCSLLGVACTAPQTTRDS